MFLTDRSVSVICSSLSSIILQYISNYSWLVSVSLTVASDSAPCSQLPGTYQAYAPHCRDRFSNMLLTIRPVSVMCSHCRDGFNNVFLTARSVSVRCPSLSSLNLQYILNYSWLVSHLSLTVEFDSTLCSQLPATYQSCAPHCRDRFSKVFLTTRPAQSFAPHC